MKPTINLTKQFSKTDVQKVKRQNAESGMSYNEVFELLGKNFIKEKNKN